MLPLHHRPVRSSRRPGSRTPCLMLPGHSDWPSSSTPEFGEKDSNLHCSWFRARRHTVRRSPSRSTFRHTFLFQVRGEGLEPSRTLSKSVSLPLADPRKCPAGIEPAWLGWKPRASAARPRTPCRRAAALAGLERKVQDSNLLHLSVRPLSRRFSRPHGLPSVSCGGRIRTCDGLLNRQLPYRLGYTAIVSQRGRIRTCVLVRPRDATTPGWSTR